MPEVHPGSHKYSNANAIPYELGSEAARRGDAMAVGANGSAVRTTGDNGFLGVLQIATQADADADVLGPGVDSAILLEAGDTATLAVQGVVRAKVSAVVGDTVGAGEKIAAGTNGTLANIDGGNGSPVKAGLGEAKAVSDEDADGYALVFLG